ncbi:MAG: hypothetical protein ACOX87_00580 [Chloroflexota bacterium]
MAIDPRIAAIRGRIGAYTQHAMYDPKETTRKAREGFNAKFLREVDPDGVLPEEERVRRAEMARRAHFSRLALASVKARSKSARRKGRAA